MSNIEIRSDSLERFTLYWIDGKRTIIKGESIEKAFAQAGYGDRAIAALDWYDTGVSETHRYDMDKKEWVKYEPIHVHVNNIRNNLIPPKNIEKFLNDHHSIIVELEDKSQFVLEKKFGRFHKIGWVEYIELVFGEYHQGSYGDEENGEDHYFMAAGTEYFNPQQPEKAVEAFFKRISNPWKSLGMGTSLEEIKRTQMDL